MPRQPRRSAQPLGVVRLTITLVAMLLASCSSTGPGSEGQLVHVTASKSGAEVLRIRIKNAGLRPLEVAWPIAMASVDRGPVACPLPTADFAYEVHMLGPNRTEQLHLDGWKHSGYVGLWVRAKGSDEWRIAWSHNQL